MESGQGGRSGWGVADQLKDCIRFSMAVPAWASAFRSKISCEVCHRTFALRLLSDRKAGIRMDERWYCSSRCFAFAAERRLAEQFFSTHPGFGQSQTPHEARMPLTLLLIRRGCLTNEQSQQALDEQKESGGEIGELLMQLGYVTEKQVTAARAAQWGCPVYAVQKMAEPVPGRIPPTLIKLYSLLPLHYSANTNRLLVGFVHGIEYGLLYAIEQMTGCKTEACFVTRSDFDSQVEKMDQMQAQTPLGPSARNELEKGESISEEHTWSELKFDHARSASEMAEILCAQAVKLEADKACIGKSRDYLWARLNSGPATVDLLFNAN